MSPTLRDVDAELTSWRERLATASRNISELSELPDYACARAAASGSGRTAQEAVRLVATMDELWQGILLIGAALDRAAEARGEGSKLWRGEDAAARAWGILQGPSIAVDLTETPVLHRRLLARPRATATVSPEELLETMDAAFDRARERLGRITEATSRADTLFAALAGKLGGLPGQATLSARLASANQGDPLDRLDALQALQVDIEIQVQSDQCARDGLETARRDLVRLDEAATQATASIAACHAATGIAPAGIDQAALRELAAWLERIERTRAGGRPEACSAGLANWRMLYTQISGRVRDAADQAAGALARRDELRARFGALRAKHRARGGADPRLGQLENEAKTAISAEPADLETAASALLAFQTALAQR